MSKELKFQCTKGVADLENTNVVAMEGDFVKFVANNEGVIFVEGIAGWCEGFELTFTPKEFVEHFKVVGI